MKTSMLIDLEIQPRTEFLPFWRALVNLGRSNLQSH